MAAIEKLYLNTYEDYLLLKDWCKDKVLVDKYYREVPIKNYLFNKRKEDFEKGSSSVLCAPYYVDAFLIRNCPFPFIREGFKINYGEDALDKIKQGKLYAHVIGKKFEPGKHFKCIKHPGRKFNSPYGVKDWFIDIEVPSQFNFFKYNESTGTWDHCSDFVDTEWSSSTAFVPSIKSLKRKLSKKWELPVGTIVTATDRYVGDDYVFVIKK